MPLSQNKTRNKILYFILLQAASSMLLANLEREKELLRVFLTVSQMENKVLRRMNLSSFLMVSKLIYIDKAAAPLASKR